MFELADRLVGIYKTDNCTKSITINPGSFVVGEQAACCVHIMHGRGVPCDKDSLL